MSAIYADMLPSRTIRILEPCAGDSRHGIECRPVETSLDDVPPHEALSYVCGNSRWKERISCIGQDKEITTSLAQALRRLHTNCTESDSGSEIDSPGLQAKDTEIATLRPQPPKLIWADALHINPEDVTERNAQLQLLQEVYLKAIKIVVWLGPDEDGHRKEAIAAIELIALFVSTYQQFVEDMR